MTALSVPSKSRGLHILKQGPNHDPDRGHLFIVLTELCPQCKQLLVPVGSLTAKSDRTCIIGVGDHPFLRHDSFVIYNLMKQWDDSEIQKNINSGLLTVRDFVNPAAFAFICHGIMNSRLSSPTMQAYYQANK